MTPEEYNERMANLYGLVNGDLAEITVGIGATELLASIKERIYGEGKNSQGSNIGRYSTKPIYAPQKIFIAGGFTPQGKNRIQSKGKYKGQTIGDIRVSTYKYKKSQQLPEEQRAAYLKKGFNFQKDYKRYKIVKSNFEQRKTMYLPEGYKQLRDVQSLRTDIMNLSYSGALLADYQMQKTAQAYLLGFTSEEQSKKRQGLEQRFGHVMQATSQEQENYINRVNGLLSRLTIGTLEEGHSVNAVLENTQGFHY